MLFEKIKKEDLLSPGSVKIESKNHVVSSSIINNELNDYLTGKTKKGYGTGIDVFDNHFRYKRNEFYVMTGKKGSGKTTINQVIQIMGSIVNGLIWVVAFQENENWSMKLNYIELLLGEMAGDILKTDPYKYKLALKWIDKHFIFLKVDSLFEATEVTKILISKKIDVYALVLDPINGFKNDLGKSGNSYQDGVESALELLKFSLAHCSIYLNQHPIMSGQRQDGAITSYQGEGGWFLNKASFTYVINRGDGNDNELIIENVRNKHTGGNRTKWENPIVIEWSPTKINIGYRLDFVRDQNVIQELVNKSNIFK